VQYGEKGSGVGNPKNVQDFYKIREECLKSGKLFEDPEFPATDRSVYHTERPDTAYKWQRPKDFCKNPKFFVDGFSRFDVKQGQLGDCWFLAATANLTQHKKLFTRVVCEDNSFDEKYAGIFHFV
jgi:calpain, invertebrate